MIDHTVKSYNEQLDHLKTMTIAMGQLTEAQLKDALDAVERSDPELAQHVIEREPHANHSEHEIDELAIGILALRQPVAIDLRSVLSALRIANELERICDYAADLAERFITLGHNGGPQQRSFMEFGRFAATMLHDAMSAYENSNPELAENVWGRDKKLDEIYTILFRDLVTRMVEDPERVSETIQLLFMARGIERVGDRATNIAENVLYLVRGTLPGDDRPKGDATRRILLHKPN
jgi:phosphate transport system protein